MEEREPKLGAAVGRKGVGKTHQTKILIKKYVLGNPSKGVAPRRVLVLDVNDEFTDIKAISIKDIMKFSVHQKIEARRIRPFLPNGMRMTINDIQDTLFKCLNEFRGGLLLLEDINRYTSDSLPNDLIGAICTNRHTDTDIIMHFQSIGRITPKIWQNLSWLRFHKNSESVDKHRKKFEDKYEMLKIVENYVNREYSDFNDKRFFCYVDIEEEKIRGVDQKKLEYVIDEFIADNHKRLINPALSRSSFSGKAISKEVAIKAEKTRILKDYFFD